MNESAPQLPHGPGFRFLDTVQLLSETSLLGRKWMNPALPFFADHFPGNPLVPGVLLIECAAQAAGCLWSERRQDPRFTATVAQVNLFRFLREVRPDQTVEVTVKLEKDFGTLAQFEAELRVEDTPVALGRLTLSQGRSP